MPQTKPIVSIENVVASATVNQTVNLNLITQIFPDVEYHPDQFPGLVFRLKSPKTATLIFSSGKMVCTGAKSEDQAIKAVKNVVQKLKKGGIPIEHERNRDPEYSGICESGWKNSLRTSCQRYFQEVCMNRNSFLA